ncbi:hypothetical protein CALVIDRAFT_536934 [Calocera viscosa TUFC12733]|uniref:MYND-type domain-containing protein n=1 Tax=Calocera viscosa (strain TUFC12733) TaxID=1330018 RepID=A0A167MCD3_CALVF|nr:hypothetical protein CALVIDRAFT_536934 [Calocera viscosa TUFC12733]
MKVCGKCRQRYYCSKVCQKADWYDPCLCEDALNHAIHRKAHKALCHPTSIEIPWIVRMVQQVQQDKRLFEEASQIVIETIEPLKDLSRLQTHVVTVTCKAQPMPAAKISDVPTPPGTGVFNIVGIEVKERLCFSLEDQAVFDAAEARLRKECPYAPSDVLGVVTSRWVDLGDLREPYVLSFVVLRSILSSFNLMAHIFRCNDQLQRATKNEAFVLGEYRDNQAKMGDTRIWVFNLLISGESKREKYLRSST